MDGGDHCPFCHRNCCGAVFGLRNAPHSGCISSLCLWCSSHHPFLPARQSISNPIFSTSTACFAGSRAWNRHYALVFCHDASPYRRSDGAQLHDAGIYRHRAIAVALGIAGGLIILQPGFRAIDLGAIAQLVAAPLFAVSMLIAKNLTRNESNGHILLMLSVFCTLTLTLPAIAIWRQPTLEELSWLFLCAFFATAGHYCMTMAFRSAEIAALQPITFLQLVWATLMGLFLFGEQPNFWVWLGGGIIVVSATYNARKERTVRSLSD